MTAADSALSPLASILFDPLGWLAASCIALVVPPRALDPYRTPGGQRMTAWINQVILDTHALSCSIDGPCDLATLACIDAWPHLRRAAYLAGCRCLRRELVVTGRFARLDAQARHYALLPVVVPRPSLALQAGPADDIATLTAQGYLCLFREHTSQSSVVGLPLALRQRLRLMFADVEVLLESARPRCSESAPFYSFPTLLDSAILYAKSHSNAHPSPRH